MRPWKDNARTLEEWNDPDFIQTLTRRDDKHLGWLEVESGVTGAEHKDKETGVQKDTETPQ